MNQRRGMVAAELSPSEEYRNVGPDQLAEINERIRPLAPLAEGDVYVRAMYIVSDQVNSYGGRFPAEEFPTLIEQLVDSPVLVGHRKDHLPIGRTFHAERVERDGRQWIRSSFYWLRSSEGAESLRENIDGGVVKECSIGFTYLTPECSLCGVDIRDCRHRPLETYIINGKEDRCHFNYRGIQRVLETSLVYRGATPETSITNQLAITKTIDERADLPEHLYDLSRLGEHESFVVIPSYEGIDIQFRLRDGGALGWRTDGRVIDLKPFGRLTSSAGAGDTVWFGRLVGYRGKERCSRAETERYLYNGTGPVSRVTLFVFPGESGAVVTACGATRHRVQMIRHSRVKRAEIQPTAKVLTTKRGVEILCGRDRSDQLHAYLYHPHETTEGGTEQLQRVSLPVGEHDAVLQFDDGNDSQTYILRRFALDAFMRGRRFIADRTNLAQPRPPRPTAAILIRDAARISSADGTTLLRIDDNATDAVAVRPILLNGNRRLIGYRLPKSATAGGEDRHVH